MLVPYKLLVLALLAALVGTFVYTFIQGDRARRPAHDHRRGANWTVGLTLALIAMVKIGLWLSPAHPRPPWFWVHVPVAVAFLALILVMRFWITGRHNQYLHITFGLTATVLLFLVAISGLVVLFGTA